MPRLRSAALALLLYALPQAAPAQELHLPAHPKGGKLPVIVVFGGDDTTLRPLLESGEYAGVSARPAELDEARAVIAWVRANAPKHGLDAERIGVWGKGDAARLALMVGLDDGGKNGIAAIVNFGGVTDTRVLAGDKRPSPIAYVTLGDPPVLTVHGTEDPVVPFDQAVRLDVALRTAGVRSTLVRIEGAGHGDLGAAADSQVAEFFARHLLGKIGRHGD
jgi:acetyl esterase/lipase